MVNLYKILFTSAMILGTLITIASYSWFSMWIGLEINLLSIIPLLKSPKSLYPAEAMLKYFITQVLASTILMFAIIMSMNLEAVFTTPTPWTMVILSSALLTKMGAAPFHAWFPEVMEGLSWETCLLMLTWQKIAPMILFSYNLQMTTFISFIIITSTIISGLMGFNQISMRKVMAYSSINHIAWMIASMMSMKMIWILYFSVYSIISLNIIFIFKYLSIFTMQQLFMSFNSNKLIKIMFALNFLSLGGLPPFMGFFPKWLVINTLIQNNFLSLSFILIIFTLITMFFYLRLTFPAFSILSNEIMPAQNWMLNFKIMFINSVSLMGLLICTLTFSFF